MVSAKMNGLPLLVASWYGEPNPIPSTEPMTPGCWAPDLGNPGPVAITTFGHWEIYPFSLDEDGALLGITAANAETVYNLWGSATTELHATFITQLLGRCG